MNRFFILLTFLVLLVPVSGGSGTLPTLTVTLINQAYQSLGNNCYAAQITLNITSTLTTVRTITIRNIYLYALWNGITLSNSTNYVNPTNTISQLIIFPATTEDIQLDFNNFCLPLGISGLKVFLYDSTSGFKVEII